MWKLKESDIQRAIRDYLTAMKIPHIKRELGPKMVRGGKFGKNENKGFPDLQGTFPESGRMFCIEVKVPGKKLSPEQESWRQRLTAEWSAVYIIATSVEDVRQMLDLYREKDSA